MRAATPEQMADYERDRLPEPSLLAIETAIMVRNPGIKLVRAAQLIEAYAEAEAEKVRLEAVAAGAHP
jgi:hypothetical protein